MIKILDYKINKQSSISEKHWRKSVSSDLRQW